MSTTGLGLGSCFLSWVWSPSSPTWPTSSPYIFPFILSPLLFSLPGSAQPSPRSQSLLDLMFSPTDITSYHWTTQIYFVRKIKSRGWQGCTLFCRHWAGFIPSFSWILEAAYIPWLLALFLHLESQQRQVLTSHHSALLLPSSTFNKTLVITLAHLNNPRLPFQS